MKETLERASRGAAELSDDMLDLVSGGASQTVDEAKQSLMRLEALAEQYKAAQDNDSKNKGGTGGAYQDAFQTSAPTAAIQNAMKQGLMKS